MKQVATIALCATLGACATPGRLESLASADTPPEQRLEVLKEVNRHIELCDRYYAWPISITWTCRAKQDQDLGRVVAQAVKDALAEALPAKTAP